MPTKKKSIRSLRSWINILINKKKIFISMFNIERYFENEILSFLTYLNSSFLRGSKMHIFPFLINCRRISTELFANKINYNCIVIPSKYWEVDQILSAVHIKEEYFDHETLDANSIISSKHNSIISHQYDDNDICLQNSYNQFANYIHLGIKNYKHVVLVYYFSIENCIGFTSKSTLYVFEDMHLKITSPVYYGSCVHSFSKSKTKLVLNSEKGKFTRYTPTENIVAINNPPTNDCCFWAFAEIFKLNSETSLSIVYICPVCNILRISDKVQQTIIPNGKAIGKNIDFVFHENKLKIVSPQTSAAAAATIKNSARNYLLEENFSFYAKISKKKLRINYDDDTDKETLLGFLKEVKNIIYDEKGDAKLLLSDINFFEKMEKVIDLAILLKDEATLWCILNFFYRENLWQSSNATWCIKKITRNTFKDVELEVVNKCESFPSTDSSLYFFSEAFLSAFKNEGVCKNFKMIPDLWFYAEPCKAPIEFEGEIVRNLLQKDDHFSFHMRKMQLEKNNNLQNDRNTLSFKPKLLKIPFTSFYELDLFIIEDSLIHNNATDKIFLKNGFRIRKDVLDAVISKEKMRGLENKIMLLGKNPPPEEQINVAYLKTIGYFSPKLIICNNEKNKQQLQMLSFSSTTASNVQNCIMQRDDLEDMVEKIELIRLFFNQDEPNKRIKEFSNISKPFLLKDSTILSKMFPFVTKSAIKYCSDKMHIRKLYDWFITFYEFGDSSTRVFMSEEEMSYYYNDNKAADQENRRLKISKMKMNEFITSLVPNIIMDVIETFFPNLNKSTLKDVLDFVHILCNGCSEAFQNAVEPQKLLKTYFRNSHTQEQEENDDTKNPFSTLYENRGGGILVQRLRNFSIKNLDRIFKEVINENKKIPIDFILEEKGSLLLSSSSLHNGHLIDFSSISGKHYIPGVIEKSDFESLLKKYNFSLLCEIEKYKETASKTDKSVSLLKYESIIEDLLELIRTDQIMEMDDNSNEELLKDQIFLNQHKKIIENANTKRKIIVNFNSLHLKIVINRELEMFYLMVPNIWKEITFSNLIKLISFNMEIVTTVFKPMFVKAMEQLSDQAREIFDVFKLVHSENIIRNLISENASVADVFDSNSLIDVLMNAAADNNKVNKDNENNETRISLNNYTGNDDIDENNNFHSHLETDLNKPLDHIKVSLLKSME